MALTKKGRGQAAAERVVWLARSGGLSAESVFRRDQARGTPDKSRGVNAERKVSALNPCRSLAAGRPGRRPLALLVQNERRRHSGSAADQLEQDLIRALRPAVVVTFASAEPGHARGLLADWMRSGFLPIIAGESSTVTALSLQVASDAGLRHAAHEFPLDPEATPWWLCLDSETFATTRRDDRMISVDSLWNLRGVTLTVPSSGMAPSDAAAIGRALGPLVSWRSRTLVL